MSESPVVPLAETSDELEANLWADALRDDGIRAEIITLGTRDALGGGVLFPGASFRLIVSSDDLALAQEIVAGLGGESRLAVADHRAQANPMRIVWIMAAVIGAFFGAGILLNALAR